MQTLAQAIGGNHHILDAAGFQQPLQHHRAIGQAFHPALGHDLDLAHAVPGQARQQAAQAQRPAARDGVLLQHMQRIILLLHVDAGETAPGAAHRVQGRGRQARNILQPAIDDVARLVGIALALVHQAQRPQGQCKGSPGLARLDRHHVQAAAAQVGHQAVGIGNARHHALGRDACLVLARQNPDRPAPGRLGPADEFRAIAGIARRRRRHRVAHLHLQPVGDHAKARQRLQRRGAAFGMQPARADHVASDGADGFFILQGGGDPALGLVDHQAHRIGADVDDGDRAARTALDLGLQGAPNLGHGRHLSSGASPESAF